ncbi:MAG: hypothetical protein WC708_16810 [Lentisphaeria bacterium]
MPSHVKSFLLALSLIMAAEAPAHAAEKTLVGVNFGSPSWRELMPKNWGNIAIDGDVARLTPQADMQTALLPVRKGDCITATLDASCKGVVPSGNEVIWATIHLYDKTKSEYAHRDICLLQGDSDWRLYKCKFMPDERCGFISVELTNFAKVGHVLYRNLKISLRDESVELIGDSGFEDVLGANHWFFKRDGADWDGLKCWEDLGRADLDTKIVAAGTKSLRLSGGGVTLVSKPFPYDGENLIISGWLRSDGITPGKGKPSWAGGAVQLVGLNEKGVEFCHRDLEILLGTTPWCFRQNKITFPRSVKKVQVSLRLFDGAKGTLWLDEVRLRSQSPDKAPPPFNKDKAEVSIDFSKPEPKDINYKTWAGVDACASGWLTRPDVQQCLPYLKAAGFEYLRLREMSNMLDIYPRDDKDGKPVYTWNKFDKLFDLLVNDYHFVPVITLGTTPPALDRPGSRECNWANGTAPSDMKKWGAFTEAIFEHVIQRYGKAEVGKWLWEIWNEPCLPSNSGEYIGNVEDFVAMAEETYLAKERVDARYGTRIMLGLTSGSPGANAYIVKRLKSIGKLYLVEHISYHNYAGASDSISIIPSFIEEARTFMKALSGRKDYLVGETEWNSTAMSDTRPDTAWNATMAVKMVRVYLDSKLDYATYFALVDHPEQKLPPALFETNTFGMFTRPNDFEKHITYKPIPKPVYNAFVFLNELKGGRRLPFASSNDPVDGIAVSMPDGSIRMVLTSYDEDLSRQPYVTQVTVTVKGLPMNAKYRSARLWAADEHYGNSYGEWIKLGRTPISDVKANEQILKASKFGELAPPGVFFKDGTAKLTLPLPGPGIRLIELKPE